MATLKRPQGFRGGIARWVTPEDVRDLAEEIASLETVEELARWAEARGGDALGPDTSGAQLLVYRCRLGDLGDVAEPLDHGALTADLIIGLAARRRDATIRQHVAANGFDPYVAMGGDGSGRSLLRCPACDGPIQSTMALGNLYCRTRSECQDAQAAEVAELIGASA